MGSIQILSSNIIKATKSSNQKIDLTPWDLQFLLVSPNKKGLLFHHPLLVKQIQRLKDSLSFALAFFPPLAGRLEITEHEDNLVSCSVTCNNAGVLFVHAVAENTCVDDILQPTYVPLSVYSFFPFNGNRNYEGTSLPLLAVQVTELVDGFFIGCTFNHVIVDGKSIWHFINSWAEISRGCSNQISKTPTLERWFPNGIQRPIRFPLKINPLNDIFDRLSFSSQDENLNPSERLFHFSKEKIALIKSKASIEIGINKISSLQALLTHIWRSVVRSKKLDPQEKVYYMVVIGIRPRFVPPLPEDYFGNALIVCPVTMEVGDLLEKDGLGKGVLEITKIIYLHSDEKIKNEYDNWLKNPNIIRIGSVTNNNCLTISSSQWFDVYGNDFGWGKPVAVRSGNNVNGIVTVFAGKEEGSIDTQICLPYETLEAMGNDPEFMFVASN